ncbi:hypothetical protein C5167_008186 [Papaver somniferum]|uniref:Uncharacterized protein n=1 Tax=Papaver somniferum TaxID=3469 RepID=A0A4Y7JWR2_PAPSO|nr:hypothetical protein C5167_008186 [Papaver somniferum]
MNREQHAYKSMGVFAIFKEAFKIIVSQNIIYSQITLAVLVPLTILYLSQVYMLYLIQDKTYQYIKTSRLGAYDYGIIISVFINTIIASFFSLFLTSNAVYATTCFYTSRDITFKKVIGVFPKVYKRLYVTLLWCFYMLRVYTMAGVASLWYFLGIKGAQGEGWKQVCLMLIFCLSIPFLTGLVYMTSIWNIATVIAILEEDYGKKALLKSMKLIRGKIRVSCVVFLLLEITLIGILSTFILLVAHECISSVIGTIFAGIVCCSLMTFVVHFSLVTRTVIYFICKAYHNEDIRNINPFPDVSYVSLVTVNDDRRQLSLALV